MDYNKIIEQVLLVTLPPLFASITAYCITYVKKYLDGLAEDKRYFVSSAIRIAVSAAEQLFKAGNGQAKKVYAIDLVTKILQEQGIKVNVELIEAQIEAAVFDELPKTKNEYLPKG